MHSFVVWFLIHTKYGSEVVHGWLQFVRVHVGPYQAFRTRPPQARSGSPFWNEDLMFVAAEPFDETMHLFVEDRLGPNVKKSPHVQAFPNNTDLFHSTL
jgi:hypothetical protein